jgi:hypothetical protein
VSGHTMRRTYKGLVESSYLDEMTRLLEEAVLKFSSKKK